ncbi:hypothetical protein B0H11DRAFT_2081838 [Mycena galericulata]|nr:hypothetical protein B0H11DRAFT_2081838 [Mycena galericulata]
MPTRTSPRFASDISSSGPSKLRATVPAEPIEQLDDTDSDVDENNASLARYAPRHLDEPWEYIFQPNDRVWIRNHDKWIKGRIFPRSVPKMGSSDDITYWNVLYQDSFGHKLRKYFAPLLGELKPDTSAVRSLLREAHWIN